MHAHFTTLAIAIAILTILPSHAAVVPNAQTPTSVNASVAAVADISPYDRALLSSSIFPRRADPEPQPDRDIAYVETLASLDSFLLARSIPDNSTPPPPSTPADADAPTHMLSSRFWNGNADYRRAVSPRVWNGNADYRRALSARVWNGNADYRRRAHRMLNPRVWNEQEDGGATAGADINANKNAGFDTGAEVESGGTNVKTASNMSASTGLASDVKPL